MASYFQQGPPSPPFDDNACTAAPRCSLPSISNLLDLADQGSPTSETAPYSRHGQMPSPRHLQLLQQPTELSSYSKSSRPNTRPPSSHSGSNMYAPPNGGLPPTPPMTTEASFSGYNSPSMNAASRSSTDRDSCEATPPPRYAAPSAARMEHQSSSTSSHYAPSYRQQQWQHYPGPPPPRTLPAVAAYPPRQAAAVRPTPPPDAPSASVYYQQQPLPGVSSFSSLPQSPQQQQQPSRQPSPQLQAQQPLPPPMQQRQSLPPPQPQQHQQPQPQHQHQLSPWQHHHYISPAMAAAFPLAQDRYVCGTCSKAFSRPSSLRIHSHSHTGEKPFKCPHQGCGKAFSVRSNMKRHERGCHSYETAN